MPMGEKFKHESMGLIGMYRTQCRGVHLHGSDVSHGGYISLRICESRIDRHLNKDWHHADRELIEVKLSHAQFAEMISNMNCGDGVPCTLDTVMGKRMEEPIPIDRKKQYTADFDDDITEIGRKLDSTIDAMTKLMTKNGASKKQKQEILDKLKMAKQGINSNMPFVRDSFGKCLDNGVEDAKRNIEGHALNVALNAAKRGLVTDEESRDLIESGKSVEIGYSEYVHDGG